MANGLDTLVDDILIQILQALSVHAVLSLRKTSRRYYLLTKLRCVWHARFCADVLARNLPLPGPACPLSLLSATELERRTLRALHLHHAWPRLSANVLVSKHHHGAGARVDQVVFIPGGTELLTVQGDKVVHWLIVSWPGFAQGLKHVGEWTPFEGVPCRVVKDGNVPGVIAIGPRDSLGSHRFAKVLSTSLKAPFVMLCDYARVPGVVAGIWRHLLLLDTTRELGGGGLELLDWRAQTTGTALLPRLPDLFGSFLDFVVFAGHILVVWEQCVSVFPIPRVPADGQVVLEHKRVFVFQEAISRPVGFTTCVARRGGAPNADLDQDTDWDADWDWDEQRKRSPSLALGMSPTLTIAARSRGRAESVSMVMLVPLMDEEDRKAGVLSDTSTFPYRLTYLPPHVPLTWRSKDQDQGGEGGVGDSVPRRACTTLCLGSSGRGVFVVGRELRLVSPGLLMLPPCEMEFGPVFEMGEALYLVDRHRTNLDEETDGHRHVWGGGGEEENVSVDKVDFDEGMGRFVVAKERGGFEVVQLD
ncbi:hypothetical protein J3R82DRAFT_1955 [Butyriboletus roseoflavus]|nr:hypothetical protein J3R82DRAFT_1955 [Butyriboletus roseoflavus]